jgi:hypothetical protein
VTLVDNFVTPAVCFTGSLFYVYLYIYIYCNFNYSPFFVHFTTFSSSNRHMLLPRQSVHICRPAVLIISPSTICNDGCLWLQPMDSPLVINRLN